jgi:hypothetical protein
MKKYIINYTVTHHEVVYADELAEADLTIEQYAEYIWNDREMATDSVVTEITEVME